MLEEKTYKSYKELKEAMQWKTNSNQITEAQLEELTRVCDYVKDGRAYRIIKLKNKNMEDILLERELITPSNKDYDRYLLVELLLILKDFADKEGTDEIPYYSTRMKLMEDLNMINKNYRNCFNKQEALSSILNIEQQVIEDFYNSSSGMMEKDINRVLKILNNLNDSKLFFITTVQRGIWEEEGKIVYCDLSDEQLRDYERCTISALEELKIESVQESFLKRKLDELYTLIDKKMNFLYEDYISSYKAYKIIFTYESINYVLKNRHKNKRTLKKQVNEGVINSILELAIERHNKEMIKAYEEDNNGWGKRKRTENIRIKDYYIEETNKLNNNLINTNAKNINNRVNKQHDKFIKSKK